MLAKLARFYGFSHKDMLSMNSEQLNMYYKAITRIEAEEVLMKLTIEDYPHAKADFRKRLHKNIYELANPDEKEKTISPKEFMSKFMEGKRGR